LENQSTYPPPGYDVMTLGEPLIRFTPELDQRFEQAQRWTTHVGGSEVNMAVGLARLGMRVAYLTRLTHNPLGQMIGHTLAQYQIDTRWIRWVETDRVGIYYLERGASPRPSQVIYDRAGSATSNMQPHDLDLSLFQQDTCRVLHITGISLAVSPSLAATVLHAAQLAKAAGWLVSFDVNYRSRLWSYEAAAAACEPLLALADVIFTPQRDVATLWSIATPDNNDVLDTVHARYPDAVCVLTQGANGATAIDSAGVKTQTTAFPAQIVDRIGGGDAFSAGFLYRWLREPSQDVAAALRWGAAAAALKYTIPGDLPLIQRAEVEMLVAETAKVDVQR
jgi:2-dehydro-3-deoxygluconokinase